MSERWDYGGAIERYPIQPGEVWRNGESRVAVNDLFHGLPKFMCEADLIFVDPPWNIGNLNSFITKAGRDNYRDDFREFYTALFRHIAEIAPHTCYVEVGKEYLDEFLAEMKKLFRYVTFYNSSYYHRKENLCYVIRGSRKAKKPKLDYMDEEDIIAWVCENETYDCIGDPCIGRGLVAVNAHKHGRKFVGCELNPKRLAVLLERIGEGWEKVRDRESLKESLERSGLSTKMFAELMGIKASTLRNLLCGAQGLSDANMKRSQHIAEKMAGVLNELKKELNLMDK